MGLPLDLTSSIISALVQIPIVAIFIWFILERDKRNTTSEMTRDESWRAFLKEQRDDFISHLSAADDATRDFMVRMADESKALALQVSVLNSLLIAHDVRAAQSERDVVEIRSHIYSSKGN